jgi:hypothetical protein
LTGALMRLIAILAMPPQQMKQGQQHPRIVLHEMNHRHNVRQYRLQRLPSSNQPSRDQSSFIAIIRDFQN